MTTLTQSQRNQIRYRLEDAGMPDVLAFMVAQRADTLPSRVFVNCVVDAIVWAFYWPHEEFEFWFDLDRIWQEHCNELLYQLIAEARAKYRKL